MMNMYDRVQLSLRCLGELSEFFPMLSGLIQGGVLPPLLFNIFVAVIINAAHTQFQALGLDAGIRLLCRTTGTYLDLSSGTGPTHVLNLVQLLYCDNWILISHDPKTLEAMINIIDRMVRAFGQMLAPEKCALLMIDPVFIPYPRTWPVVKLGNHQLTVITHAKFLGRIDSHNAEIDPELEARLLVMKKAFMKDRRQFYCRSSISTKARLEVFVAKVVRKTLAGCQSWNITPAQIEELAWE